MKTLTTKHAVVLLCVVLVAGCALLPKSQLWDFGYSENLTRAQAQTDSVRHAQYTLDQLPRGTFLRSDGFLAGATVSCGEPHHDPQLVTYNQGWWIEAPPGITNADIEAALLREWERAGWRTTKDEQSLGTPNIVAVTTDGYRMYFGYSGPNNNSPLLIPSSPCFPRAHNKADPSIPRELRQS